MAWVEVRKWMYLPVLIVFCVAGYLTIAGETPVIRWTAAALFVAVCLAGYIGRKILKELYASRAYLSKGEPENAKAAAKRFLQQLENEPWRRHAIWTAWGFYTLNVRAMAENNLGAACTELGQYEEAAVSFDEALNCDKAYAIPHFNLALLSKLICDNDSCEYHLQRSLELGFAAGKVDRAILALGDAYARLQQ